MAARSQSQSVIAPHTKVRGDIRGTGDLCLAGSCKGDLQIQGRVSVEASGLLKGNIDAQEIEIQGAVVGEIAAQVSILLGPSARVVGSLTAPRIEILQGAQFQGPIKSEMPAQRVSGKAREITVVTRHQDMTASACSAF